MSADRERVAELLRRRRESLAGPDFSDTDEIIRRTRDERARCGDRPSPSVHARAYFALALPIGRPFVTADARFRRKMERVPRLTGRVIGLDGLGP